MPRSPTFKIKYLHLARRNNSEARGRTTEPWSPSANRASRSFGYRVMEMVRWILSLRPHRLALLERKRMQPVTLAALDRWVDEYPDDYCDVWLSPA